MYPDDFLVTKHMTLEDQLTSFIYDVRHDDDFGYVGDLGGSAITMVEIGKHGIFSLVYRLIELALVLLVVIPNVEWAFAAMNVVI